MKVEALAELYALTRFDLFVEFGGEIEYMQDDSGDWIRYEDIERLIKKIEHDRMIERISKT